MLAGARREEVRQVGTESRRVAGQVDGYVGRKNRVNKGIYYNNYFNYFLYYRSVNIGNIEDIWIT